MSPTYLIFLLISPLVLCAEIPPIANMKFPEAVGSLKYPCETHNITTADGYINTFFRIQAKNTQIQSGLQPIYLQHGLLDTGDDFVINEEHLAPGLLIANAGYDVWIGNSRGNVYSKGHINDTIKRGPSSSYWDFSWQEMSQYDLPAAFEYIANVTQKEKIHYLGHSQGTVQMFAALARQDPVIMKYLGQYHAAGPVAYCNNMDSPTFHKLAVSGLLPFMKFVNEKMFGFVTPDTKLAAEQLCHYTPEACAEIIRGLADKNTSVDNVPRMEVFMGHEPGGTSVQNMNYWHQLLNTNKFEMYDFGEKENMKKYGQKTPPVYDLGKITVPVYLHAGSYDELADPEDVERLNSELTGSPKVVLDTYEYGHLTFLWNKDTVFIDKVLGYLKEWDEEHRNVEEKFLRIGM